jgi:hypothetical protein
LQERRDIAQAVALAALPWPLMTFPAVGAVLIVLNEHVFHRHVFDASTLATAAALLSLLAAAAWVHLRQEVVPRPAEADVLLLAVGDDGDVDLERSTDAGLPRGLRVAVAIALAGAAASLLTVGLLLRPLHL